MKAVAAPELGLYVRRRKEVGLGQGLDRGITVHAAMVLVVEVLGGLFDLRLGLRRRELSRPGKEPRRVLEVGRGLLRIGLSQKIGVIESRALLAFAPDSDRPSAHW